MWSIAPRCLPTSQAAVRYATVKDKWDSYIALHRSGAFEWELGRNANVGLRGNATGFRLMPTVGRLWIAYQQYQTVVERG